MDDVDPRDADEDFDEEDLLATWAAVDRHSAKFLRTTLEDVLAEPSPEDDLDRAAQQVREGVDSGSPMFDYVRAACGWTDAPALAPRALWLSAVASTISPIEDPGTDPEEQSAVTALEHADWFALVQGLVRRGVGTELDAETVITDLDTTGEDASIIRLAVTVLTPLWRTLGVLDDEDQLTALGRWGLPRALHTAWVGEDPDDYQDPRGPELSEEDAQVVLGLLAERPMDLEELRVVAAKHGIFADEQVLQRSLVWRDDVFWCSDGIWVHLPTLLAGTVLSRRLTAAEIELGILDGSLDLDLWSIVMEGRPLVAGGTVTARFRVDEKPLPGGTSVGLVGPEGWLEGFDTGDLLGMRYLDGGFALEKVDEPPAVDDRVQVIIDAAWRAARLDAEHGDPERPGASGAEVVLLALRERPDLFEQPLPPLSEIVASTELEVVEGYIGLPGTVWEPEPAYLTESERPAYRRWRAVAGAFLSSGRIPEGEVLRELAVEAMAVVDYLAPEVSDRPELDPLLEAWQDAAPARLVGVPLFLRSRAAEGRGDLASWRSLLEMAVEKDPNLPGAAEDLAFLRNVAGDVRAAVRLYEAAGLDDDWPELRVLRPLLAVPSADVGRNKPCPCGSGKKYKVCHGRTARHPLEDRSLALWGKLFAFAQRSRQRAHLLEWAHLFSGEGLMDEATVRLAMEDSFVNDVAIIEGGLADDFLELLGELLPEDERKLAIGWAGTPLRLLEVQQVVPMRGVTVRDLVDGETFEIRDRRITTQARVKDLMLGRPLDDGAGVKRFYSDPVSIPRMQRSPVLRLLRDGAPVEDLIALLYGRAMPTLQNSEGHELLTCTSRHRLSAPDEMWAQLAEGWEVDGDRIVVHGPAGAGGGRTVRGSFTRSAHEVVTETNSIERLRELQGLLMKADPAAVLVSESSHPLTDMPGPGGPRTMEEPPELAPDLVAQIVRAQEDDWLANPVPALDGRTPREAAADPALRPELAALLDDFEWTSRRTPNALTMDVARLRSELGLA